MSIYPKEFVCPSVPTVCVVVCGNPVDGVTFYGPFDNAEDANYWADTNLKNDEWWVSDVTSPEYV